ncbi:MAG TPA: ion transporter [Chloroflexi bacterium]|nr:ion transporter [Chloroflexota bacterium]
MARQPLEQTGELKSIGYELFIAALSVLSIVNMLLLLFVHNASLEYVIVTINAVMTPIFLGDFLYRFFTAQSKSRYFWRKFGWADLLSSLPIPNARILRLFRLWRVFRLFSAFGTGNLIDQFISRRAENALLTVVFLVLLVLQFGALAVLYVEHNAPDASITSASDALWWVFVTITTVGYGDRYPVTNAGRLVAMLVMIAGVGLFGTLSGFLANQFLTPPAPKAADTLTAESTLADPKARIAELKQMLAAQEQATAELRAKLDEIDALL